MKVLATFWFPATFSAAIAPENMVELQGGIISAVDETTGELKHYIGVASGIDQALDEKSIIDLGNKIDANFFAKHLNEATVKHWHWKKTREKGDPPG